MPVSRVTHHCFAVDVSMFVANQNPGILTRGIITTINMFPIYGTTTHENIFPPTLTLAATRRMSVPLRAHKARLGYKVLVAFMSRVWAMWQ